MIVIIWNKKNVRKFKFKSRH